MTEPVALVFYEKLLPGQQLINRLHDLGYRAQGITNLALLEIEVQNRKPILLIAEFPAGRTTVSEAIANLRKNPETSHLAILAYIPEIPDTSSVLQDSARAAGANLIASEAGLLDQLPQLLEQVLQVE